MAADFSQLETDVSGLEEVVPSAVALLDGIQQAIEDAVTADNLADNSATATLAKRVASQKTALAEAVARNTPAAPPEA
jgi:hypothetical protein